MDWRNLPSLAALRAFEATARLGSYSSAGRELNVTHAAISQHCRALESHFDMSLLHRQGRKMVPTPEGELLARSLGDGFATIEQGVMDLTAKRTNTPLSVATTPIFAESWLMPRLGSFWNAHPDIQISLQPSSKLVDLRRDHVDVAIRYGRGTWPDCDSKRLLGGSIIVIGQKKFVPETPFKSLSDMIHLPWVMTQTGDEYLTHFINEDVPLDQIKATYFPTTILTIGAAREGYGVTFTSVANAERLLSEGAMHALLEIKDENLGYYIVTLKGRRDERVRKFSNWLEENRDLPGENPAGQDNPTT
jgi:LysR family glycine cleavage system transcriptional activator